MVVDGILLNCAPSVFSLRDCRSSFDTTAPVQSFANNQGRPNLHPKCTITSDSDSEEAYIRRVGTHKAGSITRIKLHNFLTYSDVEFRPGPRYVSVLSTPRSNASSHCTVF